ncbi:MAG: glucosamine-6-phosphate deaminase [Planctomycetaceae bacterium TMED240]|nr:glucosamine-6-phosphate deaminase [Rhodopirellula sp.]OUX05927.1 MAG: glucosamine-6-phosphate deaminase [Planctomycetaceae bacterium TMED240]
MTKTNQPTIVVATDKDHAAHCTADLIHETIRGNPSAVLGLATGGTPVGVYRLMVERFQAGEMNFSKVTTFNLDEYVGLGPEHDQSYRYFMQQQLFDHVNVVQEQTHVPDGIAANIESHVADYEEQVLNAGGIDLQLLGIGNNGHIAFNEPGSPIDSRTRLVDLTENTIEANSRFFQSAAEVPRHAITMGIGTILEARQIVLMATGKSKAKVIQSAIEGPADSANPASLLQGHARLTFVLDPESASELSL